MFLLYRFVCWPSIGEDCIHIEHFSSIHIWGSCTECIPCIPLYSRSNFPVLLFLTVWSSGSCLTNAFPQRLAYKLHHSRLQSCTPSVLFMKVNFFLQLSQNCLMASSAFFKCAYGCMKSFDESMKKEVFNESFFWACFFIAVLRCLICDASLRPLTLMPSFLSFLISFFHHLLFFYSYVVYLFWGDHLFYPRCGTAVLLTFPYISLIAVFLILSI